MMEEEEVRPARKGWLEKPLLDPLSVADLRNYIAELQSEILRTEQAISAKAGAQALADSFFKKPP